MLGISIRDMKVVIHLRIDHIIFQLWVNGHKYRMNSRKIHKFFGIRQVARAVILACVVILSAGCAPSTSPANQPLPPWTDAHFVAQAAPHDQPALWSDGETTLLAWPGEPEAPGIRLADLGGTTKVLPLGRV